MNELEKFYDSLDEPNQSCFLFLKQFILNFDSAMSEHWKWKLPFFYYEGKPFCYLWMDKKTTFPYVTFVRSLEIMRPELELGNRKKMKALTINPNKDIDIELLEEIMNESLTLYYRK